MRPLGDANCDGIVDTADLDAVIGITFGAANLCNRGDVNGDGAVSAADLTALESLDPVPAPTATATATESPTATAPPPPSVTPTVTLTSTVTVTGTLPPTATPTLSATPSSTETPANTSTITPTGTNTQTPTTSPTETSSATATISQTPTRTPTITRTPTVTRTETATRTFTRTPTSTQTLTRTATGTQTSTATRTETLTRTPSSTRTSTPTQTATRTLTVTATATISRTPTLTRTSTPTPTITSTPTASRTPTITPTLAPGPNITFFGLTTADNFPLMPTSFSPEGIPIFERFAGFGFHLVVESRAGSSGFPPGNRSLAANPLDRPDLQMQANRNLGNGSPAVCDTVTRDPNTPAGGVPGISPPSYEPSQMITDALNDLGCRLEFNTSSSPCTKNSGGPAFANPLSTVQFCTIVTVDSVWRFPSGDTLLTMRWRDQGGNLSPVRSLILRVPGS